MAISVDSCKAFTQAHQNLSTAKTDLEKAKHNLEKAKGGSWFQANTALETATTQFNEASSRVASAKDQENKLKAQATANGDLALVALIDKRQALSGLLDTLGTIRAEAGAAVKAQSRLERSAIAVKVHAQTVASALPGALHGAPIGPQSLLAQSALSAGQRNKREMESATLQIEKHHSNMVTLANQFNTQAQAIGAATFSSASPQAIGQEVDALTTKISGELKQVLESCK